MFHLPLSTIAHTELHELHEEIISINTTNENDLGNMIWSSPHYSNKKDVGAYGTRGMTSSSMIKPQICNVVSLSLFDLTMHRARPSLKEGTQAWLDTL
jgi:hypothetical protein